jgi:hypothetical protein
VEAARRRLPTPSINLFWHARMHEDPATVWLRNFIVELLPHEPAGPAAARRGLYL